MKAQVATLQVLSVPHRAPLGGRVAFAAARTVGGAAIATGVIVGAAQVLGLAVPIAAVALLALAGAAVAAACALNRRASLVAAIAVPTAAVAVFVVAPQASVEGVRALWNCFAGALADASDWRLPELALADASAQVASASLFLMICAPFAGALFGALTGTRRAWWLALLFPVPAVLAVACAGTGSFAVPAGPLAAVVAGASIAVGCAAPRDASHAAGGSMGAARATCAGLVCVLALAGLGALSLVQPAYSWRQPDALQQVRAKATAAVHDARYSAQPNALPNGELTDLTTWYAADKTALVLNVGAAETGRAAAAPPSADATVQPMYLRGFVGSVHDAQGWHGLPETDYHASDALMYWLHDGGFSPLTQLAATLDAVSQNPDAAAQLAASGKSLRTAPREVGVQNRAASSEWLYVPYGMTGLDAGACKDRADESAAPRGLAGQRSYAFTAVGGLEASYPDVAALSWIAHDRDAAYWHDESNYNAFAYEHYAKNSEADEAAVAAALGEAAPTQGSHVDYAAAAAAVTTWLSENVTYDENAAASADGALLADVLSGSKRGWSVHYATAAVAMLRHFGIPARYVEGYLVTPDDLRAAGVPAEGSAAEAGATYTVDVPAANGHAWAEMYVDGAGWVPVETVPAVRAAMPQPDWARGIRADETTRATPPPEQPQRDDETESFEMMEALRQVLIGLGIALLALLIAFDVFALLFFIVALVRRLLANRRRRLAFSDPDDTAATRSMAAWMADVARYRFPGIPAGDARALEAAVQGAYGEDAARRWARAQAVGRKAAFSTHGATGEDRARVAAESKSFAHEVARAEGPHARWIMKYVERLM